MSAILKLQQLKLSIGGRCVCRQLDWQIEPGQIWGVLGVNGVGKSTLLRSLVGLHPVDSGELLLEGMPLSGLNRRQISQCAGLVFQHQDDIFPATVMDQVLMGRHPHTTLLRGEQLLDRQIALRAIAAMELSGLEQRTVDTLSGGERRRVAIATILAQQPQLYLLDEPEAHLDPRHQQVIFEQVVQQIRTQQGAGVMALHDINLAVQRCSHLLLLFGSGEVEQGTVVEMASAAHIERLYGTRMVQIEQEGRVAWLPL